MEVIEYALGLLPAAAQRLQLLRSLCYIALGRGDFDAAAAALRQAHDEAQASSGSIETVKALMLTDLDVSLLDAQGETGAALAAAGRALAAGPPAPLACTASSGRCWRPRRVSPARPSRGLAQ